jgi:hypothetical protein
MRSLGNPQQSQMSQQGSIQQQNQMSPQGIPPQSQLRSQDNQPYNPNRRYKNKSSKENLNFEIILLEPKLYSIQVNIYFLPQIEKYLGTIIKDKNLVQYILNFTLSEEFKKEFIDSDISLEKINETMDTSHLNISFVFNSF